MFGTEDNSLRAFSCFKQLGDTLNALWLLRSASTDSSISSKAVDISDSLRSGEDMSFLRNRFALSDGTLINTDIVTEDEYLSYLFSSSDFRAFVKNNISTLAEMYREQSDDFSFNALEDLFDDDGFDDFDDEDCDTDTSDTIEEDDEDSEDDWDTDIGYTDEDFEDLGTDTSDTDTSDTDTSDTDISDTVEDDEEEDDDEEDDEDDEEGWEDFLLK